MAADKKAAKDTAPAYEPGEIIAAAQAFNTTPEIMAGALYGITGPLTKEQAEQKVKDFLSKPVNEKKRG
jgi:hypothetical protein